MRRDLLLILSMSCFAAFLSGFTCHSCPEPPPPCAEPVNLLKLCPSTEGCTIEGQGACGGGDSCPAYYIGIPAGDVTYTFSVKAFGDPASRPPDLVVGTSSSKPHVFIHVSVDGKPGACSITLRGKRCELPASAETLTVTFEHEPGAEAITAHIDLRDIECEKEGDVCPL